MERRMERDPTTIVEISQRKLRQMFPKMRDLYETLVKECKAEPIRDVIIWAPTHDPIGVRTIKSGLPTSCYKFTMKFDEAYPDYFTGKEYMIVGITKDIGIFHEMAEKLKTAPTKHRLMVLNRAGNDTLNQMLEETVGEDGNYIDIPGEMQECIRRTCHHILITKWEKEMEKSLDKPEKTEELSLEEMIQFTKELRTKTGAVGQVNQQLQQMSVAERIATNPILATLGSSSDRMAYNGTVKKARLQQSEE